MSANGTDEADHPHAPPRVLIVDDDVPTVRLTRFLLEGEGFAVRAATDGETAIKEYLSHRPDLILLDVMIPGSDGLALRERFIALGYPGPIVFITARPDFAALLRDRQMENTQCLVKPLRPDEILAAVRSALARTAAQETAGE